MDETQKAPFLGDRTYDNIKWVAQYGVPALGAAYTALAALWVLPYGFEVGSTALIISIFLGAFLGFSKKSYENADAQYDGALVMDTTDPNKDQMTLELDELESLQDKSSITLKVRPQIDNLSA